MLAALRGEDEASRRAALIALEAGQAPVDGEICRALIELLAHASKEVGRRAAGALALAAAEPAHRALVESAVEDEDPRRRWCAAFALSRAGTFDERVVRAAVEALAAPDGDVRWAAAEIACEGVRRRPELLLLVREASRSASPEQRKMALYCLRDLTSGDPPAFLSALDDSDRGVRLAGLAGLARCESLEGAAVERVIACMRADPDIGVRRAAAATVRRLADRDPVAAAALELAASESDDEDFVRAATPRDDRRKP